MKRTTLIYPLALALAVTMAGAGCKHKPVPTIGMAASPGFVGDPQANNNPPPGPTPSTPTTETQLPSTPTIPVDTAGVTSSNYPPGTVIPEMADWNPGDGHWTADPSALAGSTVHFAFDSAAVKASEQANVTAVITYLSSNPADKLMVEGNCDERGTEEYNRSLGERRALALREALAAKNIDPKRVRTISYGKDKPADPGHDEAAFAKNRRDDFVVYHPKAGAAM